MNPRLLASMLSAACALAPLALSLPAPAAAQSVVRPAQDISLSIGNGQLVNVPGAMSDVFVANDAVADVQVKSRNQLYVFGKAGGTTTVYASNSAGAVIWSANIRVGSNLDSVDSMLRLAMPEAKIGVSTMGTNTFLLTGTVNTPEDAAEAERLVQAYVGDKANVISRLRMATPLQVNLQVRIAEVSRSLVKTLGEGLWGELTPDGIDVLTLCPGATDTEAAAKQGIDPSTLRNVMSPDDVARLALDNLKNGPTYIPSEHYRASFDHLLALPRREALLMMAKSMKR